MNSSTNMEGKEPLISYIAKSDDTMLKIAYVHQISLARLKMINQLYTDDIFPGQSILVPIPVDTTIIKDLDPSIQKMHPKKEEIKIANQETKDTLTTPIEETKIEVVSPPKLCLGKYEYINDPEYSGKEFKYIIDKINASEAIRCMIITSKGAHSSRR